MNSYFSQNICFHLKWYCFLIYIFEIFFVPIVVKSCADLRFKSFKAQGDKNGKSWFKRKVVFGWWKACWFFYLCQKFFLVISVIDRFYEFLLIGFFCQINFTHCARMNNAICRCHISIRVFNQNFSLSLLHSVAFCSLGAHLVASLYKSQGMYLIFRTWFFLVIWWKMMHMMKI